MSIANYVKTKQPFVAQTFSNALISGHLSHSYLLLGEAGCPLKETAIYLAKSILCDHGDPFADDSCTTCQRIEANEYPDFTFFDGSESSIKKGEIATLVSTFQRTALERKGIVVYVIHLVENMTTEAVNALLKFLEEPPKHAYAILTTENEIKVLPTIISRCQCLRMLLCPREEVVREALSIGVEPLDAEILSHFYNDAGLLKARQESEDYQKLKSLLSLSVEALKLPEKENRYRFEKDILPELNKRYLLKTYIDYLSLIFKDILHLRAGSEVHLHAYRDDIILLSDKFENAALDLSDLLNLRGEVEWNINPSLLIMHFLFLLYHRKKMS